MNWFPNEQGIKWFLNDIWDDIHKSLPEVKAFFAGRNMPLWLINGKWEGVDVVGEVDDSIRFMSSKQIMVVPLLSGSGIRIKILEAMSIGKAVIATSIAAEGIMYEDRKNIIIADTPQEFVQAIKELTQNKDLLNTISQNAYTLIHTKYNLNAIAKELISYYNQLLDK
jgi:glycosyltransferase involved in cell wall biosynthesis